MHPKIELKHTDERGSISRLKLPEGPEVNLLFTRKGAARSGDMHNCKQFDLVLSGSWEIWLKEETDKKIVRKKGEMLEIPAEIPHLFVCKEDSWMIEWWENPIEDVLAEGITYYPRYRRIIEMLTQGQPVSLPEDFENG